MPDMHYICIYKMWIGKGIIDALENGVLFIKPVNSFEREREKEEGGR